MYCWVNIVWEALLPILRFVCHLDSIYGLCWTCNETKLFMGCLFINSACGYRFIFLSIFFVVSLCSILDLSGRKIQTEILLFFLFTLILGVYP